MWATVKRLVRAGRGNAGFSLLENLISVAIFSVGIISISMLFTQTLTFTHNSEKFAVAVNFARAQLEMLKNTPYANIENSESMTDPRYTKETVIDNVRYTSRWEVSTDDPIHGTKRVVMYVSWVDLRKDHTIQVETLFSRF
jgi:Tfp pilus assembly protein PilV